MYKRRWMLIIWLLIMMLALTALAVMPLAWAKPLQNEVHFTVPTRTPTPDPSTPPLTQPDLSASTKRVNYYNVNAGDTLTYTIVLRNQNAISTTVMLTDTLPTADYLTYVAGSATATGGTLTEEANELRWQGEVVQRTPVIIEFAVAVGEGMLPGAEVTNVAYLSDGTVISATSHYNPGFGLSINDGALYTNHPTVTLSIQWDVNYDITEMQISNDGGFTASEWIPVTDTYEGWELAIYDMNLIMPRLVYVRFRDADRNPYGPIIDDIIFDATPPEVTGVEIITAMQRMGALAVIDQDVILRITASDDNAGVGYIFVGHTSNFDTATRLDVRIGRVIKPGVYDFDWTPQSDEVHVWAMDRAGNVSQPVLERVEITQPKSPIFLPLVLRQP